ncbi:hypothetical protein [Microlunatus sp. Y2014]|uniref:hypothetical protein n=1 Tax=Microlunatus sp. Y2014 TaxID=3418488 RepID=UPI003DA73E45
MTDTTTEHDEPTTSAQRAPDVPTTSDSHTDVTRDTDVTPDGQDEDTEETFPREYVEQLRKEAAEARVKAKRADDLAQQLFHSRVASLDRLADPSDLPYDEALLDDSAALEAAVDALVATKPHLAARKPRGDIGQGLSAGTATVDLAGLLRASAS